MSSLSFPSTGVWAIPRLIQDLTWFVLLGFLVALNTTAILSYIWHYPHAFACMGLNLTLDWCGICRPVTALWRLPCTLFTRRIFKYFSRLSLLAVLYLHAENYLAIAPASFDAHVNMACKAFAFAFALLFLLRFWTVVYHEYTKLLKNNSLAGQLNLWLG
jgi:hypothetical protein